MIFTSWVAIIGMFSIIAILTLHCLSSDKPTIAGKIDWERSSTPITISKKKKKKKKKKNFKKKKKKN